MNRFACPCSFFLWWRTPQRRLHDVAGWMRNQWRNGRGEVPRIGHGQVRRQDNMLGQSVSDRSVTHSASSYAKATQSWFRFAPSSLHFTKLQPAKTCVALQRGQHVQHAGAAVRTCRIVRCNFDRLYPISFAALEIAFSSKRLIFPSARAKRIRIRKCLSV